MRVIRGEDLLAGDDDEFVRNLYAAVLSRMPDEEGRRHYLRLVANDPGRRRDVVEEVAESDEARATGVTVRFGNAEPPAPAAPPLAPVEEPGPLRAEIAALRRELDLVRVAAATTAALRPEADLGARLDRIEAALEGLRADVEALHRYASGALKRQLCDYVNDLLSIEGAHLENRIRLVEKRLLERDDAGAPRPAPR